LAAILHSCVHIKPQSKQQYILTAAMFVYWHRGHDKKLNGLFKIYHIKIHTVIKTTVIFYCNVES